MFLFCKKEMLLLFVQLRKSPETLMQKILEKVKKSPGKCWNLNRFFLVGTMQLPPRKIASG